MLSIDYIGNQKDFVLEGWVNFNVFFGCPTNQFDATSFILSDKMTKQPARLSTMDLDAL